MKTVTYDEMLWKLVPVEPTEEMLCAGDDVLREAFRDRCIATRTIYDAMLAATPAPAQQERKPMTDEERHALFAGLLSETVGTPTEMFRLIVERVERHHGIKE